MPSLLSSLISAANALSVFDRAMVISQNNVINASTPGYAAQRLTLQALDFEPDLGSVGGVRAGRVQSFRSEYAEQAVRRQVAAFGLFDQKAASLATLEAAFDATGQSGVPGAMSRLFQAFSAWSITPNSASARQTVIDRAREVAEAFRQTQAAVARSAEDVGTELQQTVARINELGERLLEYNLARRRGAVGDAGLDTKIQTALEELSELVDFTVVAQEDGSLTVLLGGQTPLVIGEHRYEIGVNFYSPSDPAPVYPGAPPLAHILDAAGQEVTTRLSGGRLGGLLEVYNTTLPALRGDAYHAGDLNVMAKALADRVNQILTSGLASDGPPPVAGVALFTYEASSDTLAAQSLAVDPAFVGAQLAAIDPGPPYVSNGIALRLAALAAPTDPADQIDGASFTEFYGGLAARVGRALSDSRDNRDFKSQMTAQARSLRQELSGVSLDEEAIIMIEFQRAYQAAARMSSILNELTQTVINLYQ